MEALESRTLLTTAFVSDIAVDAVGSRPEHLAEVNGILYYSAKDDTRGVELWRSDGTQSGTYMVKDIYPGIHSSAPQALTNVNGMLFFVAHDGTHGFELWQSDGTEQGTIMVKDIWPGPDSGANPESFMAECDLVLEIVEHAGRAYFPADDGQTGFELWTSDGTGTSTRLVGEANPGVSGSCPTEFTSISSQLVYAANGPSGRELFATSSGGVSLVQDILPGAEGSNPDHLTYYQGNVYFAADDGVSGRELWKTNAITAELVADIQAGPGGSFPTGLVVSGTDLLFAADDGNTGAELWQSRGTVATTILAADIQPGWPGSSPLELTDVDGDLFFTAAGDTGYELWTSFLDMDPTTGKVRRFTNLVRDINPGQFPNGFPMSSAPSELTNIGGDLFFWADDGVSGHELWASYLTQCGRPTPERVTVRVRDIFPGPNAGYPNPSFLASVNGTAYFAASDGTVELWSASFQNPPGQCPVLAARQVFDANDRDNVGSYPGSLAGLASGGNTVIYFAADDGQRGRELWKTVQNAVGGLATSLVADLRTGPIGSNPANLDIATDPSTNRQTLFFTAFEPTNGCGVWKIDTMGNPVRLTSGCYLRVANLGRYVFLATNQGLWKSDGTSAGTTLMVPFDVGPVELVQAGGRLYFTADDGDTGMEVWQSDGTAGGTRIVADIFPGPSGSFPANLTSVGGGVFFTADDGVKGTELYSYGPSFGLDVYDINPGSGSSYPSELTHVSGGLFAPGGSLFFAADDGVRGVELHAVDLSGGQNPSGLIKDVRSGGGSGFPSEITNVAGTVFFAADDGVNGRELWISHFVPDPVTGLPLFVTELLSDIHVGPRWSNPRNLTSVGTDRWLMFSANNGSDGDEPWMTDGTPQGTALLADINPGGLGSASTDWLNVGSAVFLAADDGTHGMELWRLSDRVVGDANGDGRFDSADLVQVFQAGEYEDGIPGNSTFEEGDWNGDGEFDSADLVLAFQAGTYQSTALANDFAAAVDNLFVKRSDRWAMLGEPSEDAPWLELLATP